MDFVSQKPVWCKSKIAVWELKIFKSTFCSRNFTHYLHTIKKYFQLQKLRFFFPSGSKYLDIFVFAKAGLGKIKDHSLRIKIFQKYSCNRNFRQVHPTVKRYFQEDKLGLLSFKFASTLQKNNFNCIGEEVFLSLGLKILGFFCFFLLILGWGTSKVIDWERKFYKNMFFIRKIRQVLGYCEKLFPIA